MKTSFTIVSLLLAVGLPGSLLAELAGISLPDAVDVGTMLGIFVAALTLLTLVGDYARPATRSLTTTLSRAVAARATEERRLAA
jgi:hypothetical protein